MATAYRCDLPLLQIPLAAGPGRGVLFRGGFLVLGYLSCSPLFSVCPNFKHTRPFAVISSNCTMRGGGRRIYTTKLTGSLIFLFLNCKLVSLDPSSEKNNKNIHFKQHQISSQLSERDARVDRRPSWSFLLFSLLFESHVYFVPSKEEVVYLKHIIDTILGSGAHKSVLRARTPGTRHSHVHSLYQERHECKKHVVCEQVFAKGVNQ